MAKQKKQQAVNKLGRHKENITSRRGQKKTNLLPKNKVTNKRHKTQRQWRVNQTLNPPVTVAEGNEDGGRELGQPHRESAVDSRRKD